MTDLLILGEKYYDDGVEAYYEKDESDVALKSLLAAAATGYEPAYGEIGSILCANKEDHDVAEAWFKKVTKIDFLSPMAQYDYGVMLYSERDDWESALTYFFKAAEAEYAPAYQVIGMILYLEKQDADEAEMWFEKAKEAGCLCGAPSIAYGVILEFERGIEGMAGYYESKAIEFYADADPNEE